MTLQPAYVVVGQDLSAQLKIGALEAFGSIVFGAPTVVLDIVGIVQEAERLFNALSARSRSRGVGSVLQFARSG